MAKKREVTETNVQTKGIISSSFSELRQRIDAKEREMLQAYDAIGKSVVQDLEHSIRLGKGRGEQLNQKCEELGRTIKMNDPVYLAEYYTQ